MKNKRIRILAAAMMAVAIIAAGCASDGNIAPSPSPVAATTPKAQNTPMAENSPMVGNSPAATDGMGTTPPMGGASSGTILEGFTEGGTVEPEKLPTEAKDAIKKQYPGAEIKSVSYATYEAQQTYKVMLNDSKDKSTTEIYVTADGEIIPAKATASASPNVSASPDSKSNQ